MTSEPGRCTSEPTETPRIKGHSFGSNVLEAMLLFVINKPQDQVPEEDLSAALERYDLR
jgi:hypothetical protein